MKWTDLPQSLPHFQACLSHSPLNCGIVPLLSPFTSGDSDDQTDVDLHVRRGFGADGMLGADGALSAFGIAFFLLGFEMGPLDGGIFATDIILYILHLLDSHQGYRSSLLAGNVCLLY